MKKAILTVIVIVIAVFVLINVIGRSSTAPVAQTPVVEPVFKIGIILPMSGPAATLGEASKKSVELALSKFTPDQLKRVEVIYVDDQFDPKQTVSVAQKLIDVDKVNAIIAYSSPSSVAASYVAEKASVPMIGLGNTTDINKDKKWVVKFMLSPDVQADAIEKLMLKGKYKKVGIVWNQSDGPKSVHDVLIKILPERGYDVVADESVTKGENDFKTSIAKLRNAKPDVVIAYISPQVGVFAKQAKDIGLNVPLVSGPPFEIVEQIKAAQGGLDNQAFVGNDNIAFIDEYHAKYDSYPTIAGDYIYDAITQIAKAATAGKTSNSDMISFLKQDFFGVSGAYRYNNDGSFEVEQVIKKWDGNKFVVVK